MDKEYQRCLEHWAYVFWWLVNWSTVEAGMCPPEVVQTGPKA